MGYALLASKRAIKRSAIDMKSNVNQPIARRCDENLRGTEGFLRVCSYDLNTWLILLPNSSSGLWLAEAKA